jgi:hypothetical protein
MDMKTRATVTKPAEAYEKMSAATTEATDLIKGSYSTAVKGAQDYNNKLLQFAQTNNQANLKDKSSTQQSVPRLATASCAGPDRSP